MMLEAKMEIIRELPAIHVEQNFPDVALQAVVDPKLPR